MLKSQRLLIITLAISIFGGGLTGLGVLYDVSPVFAQTSDATKPAITLNGENRVTVGTSGQYTELGAICVDNVDGLIAPTITGS